MQKARFATQTFLLAGIFLLLYSQGEHAAAAQVTRFVALLCSIVAGIMALSTLLIQE